MMAYAEQVRIRNLCHIRIKSKETDLDCARQFEDVHCAETALGESARADRQTKVC